MEDFLWVLSYEVLPIKKTWKIRKPGGHLGVPRIFVHAIHLLGISFDFALGIENR